MITQVKYAIVVSLFNSEITEKLLEGALNTLHAAGISKENIDIEKVPGAIEIPLIAKLLARTGRYKAIICLGAVIQGETHHHEYVNQQVSQGCQQIMLEFDLPVIFGVLTTKNVEQALARVDETTKHKGVEAANAAMQMVEHVARLSQNYADVDR